MFLRPRVLEMRHWGRITKWDDERGFGFISSHKGGDPIFFHVSSLHHRDGRPSLNEPVSYRVGIDPQGRRQANDVRFVGASSAPPMRQMRPRVAVPITFALSFLIVIAALALGGWLEMSWLILYYGTSLITYSCYSRDKTAALNARRRTPESTLHMMSLVGGWPGALIAQALLQHKTRKPSFLIAYWSTAIINCIALGMIVYKGVSPMRALLGAAV